MADIGSGDLSFAVLGPLRVEHAGVEVPVAGPKQRVLLLRLLVARNRALPADLLIDDLWGGRAPASAQVTLQSYVSRLRKLLRAERLVTESGGYRLVVADAELDAACLEADVAAARGAAAATDYAAVVAHVERARGRWRGEPLVDAEGAGWAVGEVTRLRELSLDALELSLAARLELGEFAEVVAEAEAAVALHPLRERLWGHLITGLYRQGRQAEALRAFQRVRRVLVEELGIDPGADLRELERLVLAQDSALGDTHAPERRPSGVVTFLFTDIQGSTALWDSAPGAMQEALQRHNLIVRGAVTERRGTVFATGGDGFAAAFQRASDAVAAAVDAQRALGQEHWPADISLRVRMGVHTGEAVEQEGDYVGSAVNEAARLMASAHGGQVVCSAATAALLADDVLLKNLGEHRLRDVRRPMRVFQVGDGEFPPLRALDATPGNLPPQLTSFLGRDREVADAVSVLERSRLLTLVGAGGMGKTRLAIAIAAQLAPRFRQGVWFVELAAVNDPDEVSQVLAATLGGSQRTGLSLEESVVEFARTWESLVVLDNCEHVLSAVAALVDRIVSGCPGVKILATSREALGSTAEQLWPVGPLALPDGNDHEAASVQLFVDRARLVAPRFDPDAAGIAAIAEVCRRLDGMPLAIELAASRVTNMTPAEISQLLDERFRLLTGGRRNAVERHQSLRAAVDWSYSLLPARERCVFDRLAVFAGSFDAASAAAVAADADLTEWDVRDALTGLVAKSLLGTFETLAATTRYQMAETLRAYARERIDATATTDQWRRRHAVHFADFARQAAAGLQGAHERVWWDRLEADLDNVRAAVTWALDRGPDAQLAVQIITDLGHASIAEPRLGIYGWAQHALFAAEQAPLGRRALLRAMAAQHMHVIGYPRNVVRPAAEAAMADGIPPDCPGPTLLVVPLAICESFDGRTESTAKLVVQAAADIEALGYGHYHRWAAHSLVAGIMAGEDHARALEHAEIAVACARETGCPSSIALALSHMGWALVNTDKGRALAALTEAVALVDAGARVTSYDMTLLLLARLHMLEGRLADAARLAHKAMLEVRRKGDRSMMWGAFEAVAVIADEIGDRELLGVVIGATLHGTSGIAVTARIIVPGGDAELEDRARLARDELGEQAWADLERRGAAMDLDDLALHVVAALERDIELLSTQSRVGPRAGVSD